MENKLVIHLNEESKWGMMFSNVSNFIKEVKDEAYQLHIVINGPAVSGVLNQQILDLINEYESNMVVFKVCNNSLIGRNISRTQVQSNIVIVETSVFEIMKLQQQGFAYLKLWGLIISDISYISFIIIFIYDRIIIL